MTRKEKKVFSGYHAIAGRGVATSDSDIDEVDEAADEEKFSCPELLHNIQTLIDDTEQKIISNERQKQYESDRHVHLDHQEETLAKLLEKDSKEIRRMEIILRTVTQCEDLIGSDESCSTKLESLADVISDLQKNYFAEYHIFELQDLANVLVFPQLVHYFTGWKPLEEPSFGLREVRRWKKVLQSDKSSFKLKSSESEQTDVYQKMIRVVWMPIVQAAVLHWNPQKQTEELLVLLEQWKDVLPLWIFQNILSQLVLAQLK